MVNALRVTAVSAACRSNCGGVSKALQGATVSSPARPVGPGRVQAVADEDASEASKVRQGKGAAALRCGCSIANGAATTSAAEQHKKSSATQVRYVVLSSASDLLSQSQRKQWSHSNAQLFGTPGHVPCTE
eukprot:6212389-Pleurochrysis_carterae.AAC.3